MVAPAGSLSWRVSWYCVCLATDCTRGPRAKQMPKVKVRAKSQEPTAKQMPRANTSRQSAWCRACGRRTYVLRHLNNRIRPRFGYCTWTGCRKNFYFKALRHQSTPCRTTQHARGQNALRRLSIAIWVATFVAKMKFIRRRIFAKRLGLSFSYVAGIDLD